MVTLARRAARIPFAPAVAVLFGAVAAILVAAMPQGLFEQLVAATGVATPPLGLAARLIGVALAFVLVAGPLWLLLTPIERRLDRRARTPWHDEGYDVVAAAKPETTRRRPIFAPAELGAPLMSDEAIAPPPAPEVEPEVEAALEMPLSAAEFELPPETPGQIDNSIQGLIRRLEAGLARRALEDPDPGAPHGEPLPLSADWIMDDAEPQRTPKWDDEDPSIGTMQRFAWR